MTGFLAELGRKLAERWFTLLVLPGLAYLLVAAAAFKLGQRDWHDWHALWNGFAALTEGDADRQDALAVRAVLLVLAAVPVSAALGVVAQALAGPVERALCGPWPHPFAGLSARRTRRRADAWSTEDTAYREHRDPERAARRNALSLIPPEHPTHLGDRLRAPAVRLRQEYGIDLATVWPRLWLLLPAATRDTLTEARTRLDTAFALGGWAVLYLPLALYWWPAAPVVLVTALVSRRRAAIAADVYADLVEAAVDLHLDRLHSRLAEPRPSPQQGRALTERLRRGL
ncbi:hypothetical protein DI272_35710 [Streptomyces sp. Act143]|uniref:hypothetical protein n=1 Tax=Streptomyces sp. Act143 TaxID=2200760 RepID=UPI000D67508D|nr:hypothetical protein [Streptomyces sp. Act143]PWI18898.1 hypothetical protein DI272_35710 [Streptomyces sp. Act143]